MSSLSVPVLSLVIPCLNEAESLPTVLQRAVEGCEAAGVETEIVLADNGSTDGSQGLALEAGVRVIQVSERGYGAALLAGITAARGEFVLMGDADGSYDFREAPRFLASLQAGADITQGCRLPSGGGTILPRAMPWSHRWIGNPVLSRLTRAWLGVPVQDIYCGLRAFRRERILDLGLQCQGMEFAVEMLVRSSQRGYRFAEIPVTLSPDLRRTTTPHLRTVRDGWRTLRFLLLYSPRWLFLVPGTALILLGLMAAVAGGAGARIADAQLGAHTLLVGCATIMVGWQAVCFAYLTKVYGVSAGLLPPDPRLEHSFRIITLERGLLVGSILFVIGSVLTFLAVVVWVRGGLGPLDYERTMRQVIPGVFLAMLGFQGLLFSWFFSILGVRRP